MSAARKTTPVRIQVLDREYTLRVAPGDEASARQWGQEVHTRIGAFLTAHPRQSELTASIVTALSLVEELHALRAEHAHVLDEMDDTLEALSETLADALPSDAPA